MKLAQVIMDTIRTRFPHNEAPNDVIHKAAMNCLRNSRDLHGGRKKERTKRKMIVRTLRILNFNDSQNNNDRSLLTDSQGSNDIFSE